MGSPLTPPATQPGLPTQPIEAVATTPPLLPGERVSGPMVVFDGKLYFATYAVVPPPSAGVCNTNGARIWGVDFAAPADTSCTADPTVTCNRAGGGLPGLSGLPGLMAGAVATDFQPLQTQPPPLKSAVIPGITVNATPACASAGTPSTDQYVGGGAMHSAAQNFTAGKYTLSGQVGAPGLNGGASTVSLNVPPPLSPTVIDSWAAVVE
jgi:hypothetical protein